MKKKVSKFVFWTPRIVLIVFILFLALFSLDVFEEGYGFWGIILGLFMHNLPSIILSIILLISWRHELFGAITFITLGVACVIGIIVSLLMSLGWRFNPILIIGSVVFLSIGTLFLIGWFKKRK